MDEWMNGLMSFRKAGSPVIQESINLLIRLFIRVHPWFNFRA